MIFKLGTISPQFDRTVLLFGLYLVSGALGLAIFATPDEFVATNVVLYIACQVLFLERMQKKISHTVYV